MKYLINYADKTYKDAQRYCTKMAYKRGKFDKVIEYSPEKIPTDFIEKNRECFIVGDRQIGKYGLWRPYIIMDALSKINTGDYLCYCDVGAFFIRNINYLIRVMDRDNQFLMIFELPLKEYQWTKNDVFKYFDADTEKIMMSNQRMSTVFVVKKTEQAMNLFNEYLTSSQEAPELFTDSKNTRGGENHIEFIQNRHNQSVLSVLSKIHNITAYSDPSDYGKRPELYSLIPGVIYEKQKYLNSQYPMMFISHRNGKVTVKTHIMALLRILLPGRMYYSILLSARKIRDW